MKKQKKLVKFLFEGISLLHVYLMSDFLVSGSERNRPSEKSTDCLIPIRWMSVFQASAPVADAATVETPTY